MPSKRAFATSGRSTNRPSTNTLRNAARDIAMFSRLVNTFSRRATADRYSSRNSEREIRADFGVAGRFKVSRSLVNSASQILKTAAGNFPALNCSPMSASRSLI